MLATLLLTAVVGQVTPPPKAPVQDKNPPAKAEIFAQEDFYKKEEAKEQEFVGKLTPFKASAAGGVARGPYRITYVTYVEQIRTRTENGKQIQEKVMVPVSQSRDVYVAGKGVLVEPFADQTVKIVGKPMTVEVGGKKYNEIWPATIEMADPKKGEPKDPTKGKSTDVPPPAKEPPAKLPPVKDEESCGGDKEMELKIHARARWPFVSAAPDGDKKGIQLVVRSAAELVAASPYKNSDAAKEVLEKKATEEIAKLFKADDIDWAKQMVVVVTAGVKSTGGYKIDVLSVTTAGKGATVAWQLDPPKGAVTQAFTHPSVMVLVDRVDGEVRFIAGSTPKGTK